MLWRTPAECSRGAIVLAHFPFTDPSAKGGAERANFFGVFGFGDPPS
jgi:hypothetical protein